MRVISILVKKLPIGMWLQILANNQTTRAMRYTHGEIRMCVDSWIEDEVRLQEDEKEPGTVSWIEEHFEQGDTFYDIGANVGSYSLIAHRFLQGRIRGYSFEPGFVTFPQLVRNIGLNDADRVISPFQVALYDQTTVTDFHYQNLLTGGALHALGEPVDQFGRGFQPVSTLPVLAYRLDEFADKFSLEPPNHIKIDVDGSEAQILRGAKKTLKYPGLRSLLIETSPQEDTAGEIQRILKECGLDFVREVGENSLFLRAGTGAPQ